MARTDNEDVNDAKSKIEIELPHRPKLRNEIDEPQLT
jgi:hypothetical protein